MDIIQTYQQHGMFGAILVMLGTVVGYFLPAIIAIIRKHKHSGIILGINFFLGWTVIGWIIALIWSGITSAKK